MAATADATHIAAARQTRKAQFVCGLQKGTSDRMQLCRSFLPAGTWWPCAASQSSHWAPQGCAHDTCSLVAGRLSRPRSSKAVNAPQVARLVRTHHVDLARCDGVARRDSASCAHHHLIDELPQPHLQTIRRLFSQSACRDMWECTVTSPQAAAAAASATPSKQPLK